MGEDDAVPRLVGRGHSSTTVHHGEGEGQMRTAAEAWAIGRKETEMWRSCSLRDKCEIVDSFYFAGSSDQKHRLTVYWPAEL